MKGFDVVFVGNGILSLAGAFAFKRRHPEATIAIVGPPERTGAASKAAGAMLGCFGEVTKYTGACPASIAKFEMSRTSKGMWPAWLEELNEASSGPAVEVKAGTIVLENAVSGVLDSENYEAILRAVADYDEPHEILHPRDIRGLDPVPSSRPLRAVYLPREGTVASGALYDTMHAAVSALGATFVCKAARRLEAANGRVTGVETIDGERVGARQVVCAAGAYTTPLLDTVLPQHEVQPVFAGTGISVVTLRHGSRPFSHAVRSVNRAGSCGLHVVPYGGGEDYLGATNAIFATPGERASAGLSHFLLQCAIDQLNQDFAHAAIVEWRVGNRPLSLDGFPLLGRAGSVEGLYVATGTYRDGLHNSPLIAGMIADALGGAPPPDANPFEATRAPISLMSAVESAKECIHHAVCTGFEASLVLPRLWRSEMLPAMFARGPIEMYQALETRQGLPPDLVPFLAGAALAPEGPDHAAYQRVKSLIRERGFAPAAS